MGKLGLCVLIALSFGALAAPANEGPEAGHAVGHELLDLYKARTRQLEPIPDVYALKGFQTKLQPVLQRIYQTNPKFHYDLSRIIVEKSWYFVGSGLELMPGLFRDERDIQRVGRQTDALIEVLKPWIEHPDVSEESVAGLTLHELVVGVARKVYGKNGRARPNLNDVETLVAILMKDTRITYTKLNVILKDLGFGDYGVYLSEPVKLSQKLKSIWEEGFAATGFRMGTSSSGLEFLEILNPTYNGAVLFFDTQSHRGSDMVQMLCGKFFSFTWTWQPGFTSVPLDWKLGEPQLIPVERMGGYMGRPILSLKCSRAPYYIMEVDIPVEGMSPYEPRRSHSHP